MKELTIQEIKGKLENYLEKGEGNNVENLMVSVLAIAIENMDFAFRIKTALNNNNTDAGKEILAEQAEYLSAIYGGLIDSVLIKSILDN